MDRESLSFVLVGHVDHGKSTLIGRLMHDTGSLPEGKLEEVEAAARAEGHPMELAFILDHLAEERQRGITIDTAQTFFSSDLRDYVIIDAPGHKEFLKNMITGASQAEAALLICSVYEGVQEQTKRHAYVVKLLGLDQVMVAYNKMDLVGYEHDRFLAVKRDMDEFLGRLGITPALDIPISAHVGDNVASHSDRMPWYDGPTIVEGLDQLKKTPPVTSKALRFPVQDVYVREAGRIVAGRVESGVLRVGQKVRFLPHGEVRTVRAIKKYGEPDPEGAGAGECIGVILDDEDVTRGHVGCPTDDSPVLSDRFRAGIFWLSPQPLGPAGMGGLRVRCATQEQPCRVAAIEERIDSGTLERLPAADGRLHETEVGELVLETDGPLVIESFYDVPELGRFVLVRDRQVVAGGIVMGPAV